MFDSKGDFLHEHDLEAGFWDQHGYDCPTPADDCVCDDSDLFILDAEDDFDADDWTDLATYFAGR